MEEKIQKTIGWLLIFIGLIIIFLAIYSSYHIFNAKSEAPQIFKTKMKEAETPLKEKTTTLPEPQKEMEKMISQQLKEALPLETLPKLLNLISWSIFAGILIFTGGQIANLGIKLIKK